MREVRRASKDSTWRKSALHYVDERTERVYMYICMYGNAARRADSCVTLEEDRYIDAVAGGAKQQHVETAYLLAQEQHRFRSLARSLARTRLSLPVWCLVVLVRGGHSPDDHRTRVIKAARPAAVRGSPRSAFLLCCCWRDALSG